MTSPIRTLALLCLTLAGTSGCLCGRSAVWQPPPIPPTVALMDGGAEESLAAAAFAERTGQAASTDRYFDTALLAWRQMSDDHAAGRPVSYRLQTIYRIAVARWLETSRQMGRWIPGQGIDVRTAAGPIRVPLCPAGFAWRSDEFEELHPIGKYYSPSISEYHCREGLGSSLVVRKCNRTLLRPGDRFLPPHISFSATAILRPGTGGGPDDPPAVLELWNPHSTQAVVGPAGPACLAADTSAVFAFRELSLGSVPSPLEMFVRPDDNHAFEGLYFLEPYQPGKIPVVFIHGLMSSPRTWIDMANELRTDPEFNARYQIWAFDYATGKNFLRAAAELRRALCEAEGELAACGEDAARRQIVLIGHSMGGLVSKMQVTCSGDHLWRSIARAPFERVRMSDSLREHLAEVFFFEPLPQVRRVIFMGTPHRGAALASRVSGRVGSALVHRSQTERALHQELVAANPGVIRWPVSWRLPTSIDMLEPGHPLARAVDELPISGSVMVHTIAGAGYFTEGLETGDGVVPLSSAVHRGAHSEILVKATHTHIHRTPEAVIEVRRILGEHSR